jgi:hypothetical protein
VTEREVAVDDDRDELAAGAVWCPEPWGRPHAPRRKLRVLTVVDTF